MADILDPVLHIDEIEGEPGQRRLLVEFDVAFSSEDATVGAGVLERIVVRGVDQHDAPVLPSAAPIVESERQFVAIDGVAHRSLERLVLRSDLDVEQDLWSSGIGGTTQPIAEWLDHLIATVTLEVAGEPIAEQSTPVVTGSWGVLGAD